MIISTLLSGISNPAATSTLPVPGLIASWFKSNVDPVGEVVAVVEPLPKRSNGSRAESAACEGGVGGGGGGDMVIGSGGCRVASGGEFSVVPYCFQAVVELS